jgi:hypothetical protein
MLGCGEYTITAAVSSEGAPPERIYDWVDQLTSFAILQNSNQPVDGIAYCPIDVSSSILME